MMKKTIATINRKPNEMINKIKIMVQLREMTWLSNAHWSWKPAYSPHGSWL